MVEGLDALFILESKTFIKKMKDKMRAIGQKREIGELFNMDYAAVSQATKRFEEKVIEDKKIFKMKDAVLRRLKSMSNVET